MKYTASHIFQFEDIEVEIIVGKSLNTKREAEILSTSSKLYLATLYVDKIVIGNADENPLIINKSDTDLYQFKVCRDTKLCYRTDEDLERITWDEALEFASTHYKGFSSLPYSFESSAYYICEEDKFELN
ncbi:hypothetical protein [Bacillus bombysepticus]|uniref:hypothetical protein n=1 Tax=Bacillus bombysepticus TaxID=658666 RepID=UPI003016DE9C